MTNHSPTSPAVEILGLTKIFRRGDNRLIRWISRSGRADVIALEDLTLDVRWREVFGLVGRNGAGKTTLLKIISSLIEPTFGSVRVLEKDSVRHGEEVKRSIGLVASEERSFYGRLSGFHNLQFFARMYGMSEARAKSRIEELTELFELGEVIKRRFHEFSTGNRQRLAIARALLLDPPLVLLDEPTRSLDPIAADELRTLIRERMNRSENKTVMITTHNLSEIEQLCDRVAILSQGALKELGTVQELEQKYSSEEQVTLRVRCNSQKASSGEWQTGLPTSRIRPLGDHAYEIEFVRRVGDPMLDQVFNHLVNNGAEIVGCQSTRIGLLEILEKIEQPANRPPRIAGSASGRPRSMNPPDQ